MKTTRIYTLFALLMLVALGCNKPDEPNNGGNGGNNGSGGTNDNHEYVDLGLPSGTLWATCNVGADTPEGYGDYFAWGEIEPKDYYYWNNYKWRVDEGEQVFSYNFTKYCNDPEYGYNGFTDNLTILLPFDDAATANWGNSWRTPTREQFQELLDNCSSVWTTQNDVAGRCFTGANGNTLFLPAAGYHNVSDLSLIGNQGFYWSGSLYTEYTGFSDLAWYFPVGPYDHYYMTTSRRCFGQSVRAVRSAK